MIYFTLPNLDENYRLNQYLVSFYRNNKKLFREDIRFLSYRGSFNYCYFSGDINNRINDLKTRPYFNLVNESSLLPLRFDCSNVYLTNNDFTDRKLDAILNVCENGSNFVEISNIELLMYLKEKYPHYKWIFSHNADLIATFTPEIINVMIDSNNFELVELPIRVNYDEDFINQIRNKSKVEMSIYKPTFCPDFNQCSCAEQSLQYNFYKKSYMQNCNKCISYNNAQNFMHLDELQERYVSKGIKHFRIPTCGYTAEAKTNFLLFFVDYFIKEEFQSTVYKTFLIDKEVIL